jgi:hypothetical protein
VSLTAAPHQSKALVSERYVRTQGLQQAVRGRDGEVLEALQISWHDGALGPRARG